MNNLLSYCGLVDARISASDKYLPVPGPGIKVDMKIVPSIMNKKEDMEKGSDSYICKKQD